MSTFLLKSIAILAMLLDHVGFMFAMRSSSDAIVILRYIGRIAMPLFMFFIVEGCRRTHDIKAYTKRLFLFAWIFYVPFSLFVSIWSIGYGLPLQFIGFSHTNVYITLFLGVLSIYAFNAISQTMWSFLSFMPVVDCGLLANFMNADYSRLGVLGIFLLFIAKDNRVMQIVVLMLAMPAFRLDRSYIEIHTAMPELFNDIRYLIAMAAVVVLIYLYNGKRGCQVKWIFYWFYSVHLLILCLFFLALPRLQTCFI